MFMPAISGPSITFSGRSTVSRTASVSASMNSVMPCTSAWESRFSTGHSRQARSCSLVCFSLPRNFSASASSRSDAPGSRLRMTSSQIWRSSGSMSS